jgi:chaperonin GroES
MHIIPTEDRLLVERLESETKTPGGIIIPDNAKEKPMRGKVVSVGPGRKNDKGDIIAMSIKVGDIVIFAKWSGTEIKINEKELLVMKESDVLATVN